MENLETKIKLMYLEDRKEAFDLLVKSYEKILVKYVYRLTGSLDESIDIVQEVFIKANSETRLYNIDFNMKAWLYKVSANTAFGFLRKIKRIFFKGLKEIEDLSDKENFQKSSSPLEKLIINEAHENITAKLSLIPEKFRDLIILRYYEGLSYEEIGQITGLNQGTIMSRLNRAKEKFKEVMKNEL